MEVNIKEHQLTFSKGMSNIPSDNVCDDNTLEDCEGMRMKDGELRPVQEPKKLVELDGKLLYVHKAAGYVHLVYFYNGKLYWQDRDGKDTGSGVEYSSGAIDMSNVNENTKIVSIGNTLIVNSEAGIMYAVWKNGGYKVIEGLPEILLAASRAPSMLGIATHSYKPSEENFDLDKTNSIFNKSAKEEKTAYNEVYGLIEGGYKNALKHGEFTYPFFLRAALKLYDGTYTRITPPLLVFPTVRRGAFVKVTVTKDNSGNPTCSYQGSNNSWNIWAIIELTSDISELSDVVKGVSLFMTEPVKTYKDVDYNDKNTGIGGALNEVVTDYVEMDGTYKTLEAGAMVYNGGGARILLDGDVANGSSKDGYILPLYEKTDDEIISELLTRGVFYKIVDDAYVSKESDTLKISDLGLQCKDGVLENITTQEQLPHDDYYGHCEYVCNSMYAFNSRLHIANLKRLPWQGKYLATSADTIYVDAKLIIEGRSGNMYPTIKTGAYTSEPSCFFFYPDPNAKWARITINSKDYDLKLSEHPRLNGAYYLKNLPGKSFVQTTDTAPEFGTEVGSEELNTTVMTSEVNNPWVFNAEGENSVGTGEIIGMVSNTRALSQGQFGQHPLIIFTTEGVYALGVNSEGLYSTNYPVSREVCNNSNSITPTDGAVFFTSEKGLMMMVGSEITCVSQQMMGKGRDFRKFLKDCVIAYDYKDYCLYLINTDYDYCYVYDIKSGAISRNADARKYKAVVNDYPDNLLQDGDNIVWSLLNKADVNDDTTLYQGSIVSRPVKFSNAQALKTLIQIKHVRDLSGSMTLRIFVSNDLKHWGEIKSLRGMGWKYFKFRIDFKDLKATDSYSGMLCLEQPRRTNKLR